MIKPRIIFCPWAARGERLPALATLLGNLNALDRPVLREVVACGRSNVSVAHASIKNVILQRWRFSDLSEARSRLHEHRICKK